MTYKLQVNAKRLASHTSLLSQSCKEIVKVASKGDIKTLISKLTEVFLFFIIS